MTAAKNRSFHFSGPTRLLFAVSAHVSRTAVFDEFGVQIGHLLMQKVVINLVFGPFQIVVQSIIKNYKKVRIEF
jgi:hypothetical protein